MAATARPDHAGAKNADPHAATPLARILEAATRLFLRDGFRAVGVDTIIAEAGVAKMTLYAHFPSKDDLIVAYLERANRQFWEWLDGASAAVDDPKRKLLAMFDAVGKLANSPHASAAPSRAPPRSSPTPSTPATGWRWPTSRPVRARRRALAEQAGLREPEDLADQLLLLMDGAWVAVRMFGPDNPGGQVAAAARALIQARDGTTHGR